MRIGVQSKFNNRMANSVDPDETACYEQSHLDLHCLQRYLYWSVGTKEFRHIFQLNRTDIFFFISAGKGVVGNH